MSTNTSLSARISSSVVLRYVLAIGAASTAVLISMFFERFMATGGLYALPLLAVAFSAWYCGMWPGLLATIMGLSAGVLGTTDFHRGLGVPSRVEGVRLAVYLFASATMLLLGESRRRQNDALLAAQSDLEGKVKDRTADLDTVNRSLRSLSARLMQLQDDERRRIARELHDSVGQTLAALGMNLSMVKSDLERLTSIANTLSDSENLVREMSSEVRTISHLLHPPLLDEAGLLSALRWYADGFSQRSGIRVDLDLPENFGRLPPEFETAIFRVVQEALTNIHRHSGSSVAKIRLRHQDDLVLVDIEDKGKGIPADKREQLASEATPGVGVRGMRERLRQLGGALEIESGLSGTLVAVKLPVPQNPSTESISFAGPAAA